ncbi:hypothetical protein CROQUDRAFT_87572 [Cronartium quercuum f. sp. fusiforme G11]|uniref:Uncharacterized protein n=1 Tax=Cronartium quercuum f. sp. fusiforme G11 TaxID=708437 RepID=A0A9P6NV41_9BASI|nr:hypothetical protein CROQUDRAFT_87572 [Cronartium quercuum f. sp. fusiforme G11]
MKGGWLALQSLRNQSYTPGGVYGGCPMGMGLGNDRRSYTALENLRLHLVLIVWKYVIRVLKKGDIGGVRLGIRDGRQRDDCTGTENIMTSAFGQARSQPRSNAVNPSHLFVGKSSVLRGPGESEAALIDEGGSIHPSPSQESSNGQLSKMLVSSYSRAFAWNPSLCC